MPTIQKFTSREGTLTGSLTSIFRADLSDGGHRIVSAKFTNISTVIAFVNIKTRSTDNVLANECPENLNLNPGDTLVLVEDGDYLVLTPGQELHAKAQMSGLVSYKLTIMTESLS